MKTMLIPSQNNIGANTANSPRRRELLLFFTGWGMDEHPFRAFLPAANDCLLCYDYKTLTFDAALLCGYDRVKVVAWSLGVWAAATVLPGCQLPPGDRIAVNGTHYPVDERRGIPLGIFQGTLNGLNEAALAKFRRRMCGSREACERFLRAAPRRGIDDLREELRCLGDAAVHRPAPAFAWSHIFIGEQDRIFPAENQARAWEGGNIAFATTPHYPENEWTRIFAMNRPDPQS